MTIAFNLEQVLQRIANSVNKYRTDDVPVKLVAVSKTRPAEAIREAWDKGQRCFGENYVQEAVAKIEALSDLAIEWHFIGPIQSNKTALIAEYFQWCQSVDRSKIIQRLAQQRKAHQAPLNICLQLNISREASKSGADIDSVWSLAEMVDKQSNLTLRGLMAIPLKTSDSEQQHQAFAAMYDIFCELKSRYPTVDTLSMGMSNDLEAAIAEGSTMVRIGTDIFGPRN